MDVLASADRATGYALTAVATACAILTFVAGLTAVTVRRARPTERP